VRYSAAVDAREIVLEHRFGRSSAEVDRRGRRASEAVADLLPLQVLEVSECPRRRGASQCGRRVLADGCRYGIEQRVKLGLVEESDLRVIVLGRGGLVDRTTWVGVGPALRDRELEDPIQVDVEVADRLHRERGEAAIAPVFAVDARVDEVLDVVGCDLVDWLIAEVRREVDPDLRLVVGEGRVGLTAAPGEVLDPSNADLGNRHPLCHRRRRGARLEHQRSRASAWVRVRPSRLPGSRTGPSDRFTSRPRRYHWPYHRLPFSNTAPVPRGRRLRVLLARGLVGWPSLTA
jgi:hypothetical protein